MTHYFDLSKLSGCVGIVADPGDRVVYTGTAVHEEPAEYRDTALARKLEEENDLHFWFGEGPAAPFYTVPQTELGGYDSEGGFFAGCPDFSLREGAVLYYIDRERRCWKIKGEFPGRGTAWREAMERSGDLEIFDSFEAACGCYPIRRPENQEELLNMLKGEWDA